MFVDGNTLPIYHDGLTGIVFKVAALDNHERRRDESVPEAVPCNVIILMARYIVVLYKPGPNWTNN